MTPTEATDFVTDESEPSNVTNVREELTATLGRNQPYASARINHGHIHRSGHFGSGGRSHFEAKT